MIERFDIAGYCRISVDEELDRDNTSIENQKAIITDFVKHRFPDSTLTFYEDRDRSGYTFEQRENYQAMRRGLMARKYDILIVKDFSRFSRRNSRGLVELEDLRDAGIRIISIGDNIDFPNDDDWLKIQFQFLINEMPVTDTSKKVRSVIKRRQTDGKWLCAAPYGYIINKAQQFEIVPTEADIVRQIFQLYNDGWGYKKIANHLTDQGIPTPRMSERERREAQGESVNRAAKTAMEVFDDLLHKERLDRSDLQLIIDKIKVYEDHLEVWLKSDIDTLLRCGTLPEEGAPAAVEGDIISFPKDAESAPPITLIQQTSNRPDKVFRVNVISNGDPLEIYTTRDGEVIFKKYSLISGLEDFAAQFCDTLARSTDFTAAVTDRDAVIAIAGAGKRELLGKRVSVELERIMGERGVYCGPGVAVSDENGQFRVTVAAPILCEGDVLGAVLFLSADDRTGGETECKLAQTVAAFLGKNMES